MSSPVLNPIRNDISFKCDGIVIVESECAGDGMAALTRGIADGINLFLESGFKQGPSIEFLSLVLAG